jgi:hypothetical protein
MILIIIKLILFGFENLPGGEESDIMKRGVQIAMEKKGCLKVALIFVLRAITRDCPWEKP